MKKVFSILLSILLSIIMISCIQKEDNRLELGEYSKYLSVKECNVIQYNDHYADAEIKIQNDSEHRMGSISIEVQFLDEKDRIIHTDKIVEHGQKIEYGQSYTYSGRVTCPKEYYSYKFKILECYWETK